LESQGCKREAKEAAEKVAAEKEAAEKEAADGPGRGRLREAGAEAAVGRGSEVGAITTAT